MFEIIDSHIHIGLNEFYSGIGESKFPLNLENDFYNYYKLLLKSKIDKACILPIPAADFDHEISNRYLNEAFEYSNGKMLPVCGLDTSIANNICGNFVAGKLHRVYDDIAPKQLYMYLKILEYYNKPLILHAKFKNKVKQVKDFLKIAPNLKIILAHMGRGHIYTSEQVFENLTELREFENVYFETSTVGNSDTITKSCSIIGSNRIMFGSDYPFGKLYLGSKYNYDDELDVINNAKISFADKENILSNTAKSVLLDNNKQYTSFVSLYQEIYKENMDSILKNLNSLDRKFLALDKKISIIRNCMRKKTHLFVIMYNKKFAGYLRESGRPNGVSLLEEIVVLPEYRGKGIGRIAIDFYKHVYPHNIAKTNAQNLAMINLLKTENYSHDNGKRIINWEFIGHY